jgi:hypothetical protein
MSLTVINVIFRVVRFCVATSLWPMFIAALVLFLHVIDFTLIQAINRTISFPK